METVLNFCQEAAVQETIQQLTEDIGYFTVGSIVHQLKCGYGLTCTEYEVVRMLDDIDYQERPHHFGDVIVFNPKRVPWEEVESALQIH